jgi:hypothetical protein
MSNRVLGPEQVLPQYQSVWSETGLYELRMQDDGNLVVYRAKTPHQKDGGTPQWDAWSSKLQPTWKTTDHPSQNVVLKMQGDGNLVIYDVSAGPGQERPLWETDTFLGEGTNRCYLSLQDDGNLVVYEDVGGGQEVAKWDIRTGRLY